MDSFKAILARGTSDEELGDLLEVVMEEVFAERGCLLLTANTGEYIVYRGRDDLREKFPFSRLVASQVLSRGRGLVTYDVRHNVITAASESIATYGVRSVLCVPITHRGESLGILYFDNHASAGMFSDEDLALVRGLADLLAEALAANLGT